MTHEDEPLVKIEPVVRMLGSSRRTVYRLVETKKIPHVRIGKAIRFRMSDVRKWVDANTVEGA